MKIELAAAKEVSEAIRDCFGGDEEWRGSIQGAVFAGLDRVAKSIDNLAEAIREGHPEGVNRSITDFHGVTGWSRPEKGEK
jgi:hypothetical protein